MNPKSQEKLEVSENVVEQLNAMARNCASPISYGQGPDTAPPGPAPSNPRVDFES
jgi:hypothetical protein